MLSEKANPYNSVSRGDSNNQLYLDDRTAFETGVVNDQKEANNVREYLEVDCGFRSGDRAVSHTEDQNR